MKKVNITFLVGLPRSGTTIIYNSIALHSKLAYFERHTRNPNPKTWKFPLFSRFMLKKPPPLEGGAWRRFHHEFEYLDRATAQEKQYYQMAVKTTCRAFGKTDFISKNPSHTLRIKWLYDIFPHADFIFLDRLRTPTIQSLVVYARKKWDRDYHNRHKYEHNFRGWVSIVQKFGYDKPTLDAIIAYHDYLKEKQLRDSLVIPPDKKIFIQYEKFCSNPKDVLSNVFKFMKLPNQKLNLGTIKNMNYRHNLNL